MGKSYTIWNNAKKEYVFPNKVPQKYFEMFGYSNFIVWLIFEKWSGSPIEFRNDEFQEGNYGNDLWNGTDKSEEYYSEFKEFKESNKWYFEE